MPNKRFLDGAVRDGENIDHVGEYMAIQRPRRLEFNFGVPAHSPKRGEVAIAIEPHGAECTLGLTQQMPAEFADFADRTRHGWTAILDTLARVLG